MNPNAEFDLVVYGATGYTGRLVAEYLAQRYGVGGQVKWAMAGRSAAKLAEVRDLLALPAETPLVVADADDPKSLDAMVRRAKAIITTVGPYQLYGDKLVAACVAAGTDCLDLTGEPNWMYKIIREHDAAAKALRRADRPLLRLRLPFRSSWACSSARKPPRPSWARRFRG